MAAIVVTTDLQNFDLLDTNTSTTNIGSGASAGVETDLFIQGTESLSRKASNGIGGFEVDGVQTQITLNQNQHFYIWSICTTPNQLINSEMEVFWSAVNNLPLNAENRNYPISNIENGLALGKWICHPISGTVLNTNQNSDSCPLQYMDGIGIRIETGANINLNNIAIDAIRWGRGLALTGGGTPDPDATFQDIYDYSNISTQRFGTFSLTDGLYTLQGLIELGADDASTSTVFVESNANVVNVKNNTFDKDTGYGIKTEQEMSQIVLQGSLTNASFTNCQFQSLDFWNRGKLDAKSATNGATATFDACVFADWGDILGRSTVSFDGCTFNKTGIIDANGSSFDSCVFTDSGRVDVGTDLSLVTNCDFNSSNTYYRRIDSSGGRQRYVGVSDPLYPRSFAYDTYADFSAAFTSGSIDFENVANSAVFTLPSQFVGVTYAGVTINSNQVRIDRCGDLAWRSDQTYNTASHTDSTAAKLADGGYDLIVSTVGAQTPNETGFYSFAGYFLETFDERDWIVFVFNHAITDYWTTQVMLSTEGDVVYVNGVTFGTTVRQLDEDTGGIYANTAYVSLNAVDQDTGAATAGSGQPNTSTQFDLLRPTGGNTFGFYRFANAIKTSVPAGTYSLTGNNFTGYGADNTDNAAIYFTATTGTITVNVSGGNIPTYKSDGATVVFQTSSTLTLNGLQPNTEVRVYQAGTTTEVAGVENSGTSEAFAISVSSVDIVLHNIGYLYQRIKNVDTSADQTLPIQQRVDRQYENN